ncbi:CoA ester lyase [Ralstonia pickettii]|uniref:CoA ester lyase n=1 Tax=Ralstonia pickettii TaxID=329 RepID=A0A7X2LAF9_RALPI|nr:CoA ester lyase [Ralstonia pickettii]MRS98885.1 CoA ester lyase [Ralstonia pickettii]
MNDPRSYLFVPADRPERFGKALASGADEVVIDLEDAVNPQDKVAARAGLKAWLEAAPGESKVCVRVNGTATAWHAEDLALAALPAVRSIMLPKAESAAMVLAVRQSMAAGRALVGLVESVSGVLALREIAQSGAVARLAFGSVDFCIDAGMQDEESALDAVRIAFTLESRLAGLAAPVDGVSVSLDDAGQISADTRRARALGFSAKLCIHPKQVAPVNAGFLPTEKERDWAARVVNAIEAGGRGAIAVDGKLIDKPLILLARRLLSQPVA